MCLSQITLTEVIKNTCQVHLVELQLNSYKSKHQSIEWVTPLAKRYSGLTGVTIDGYWDTTVKTLSTINKLMPQLHSIMVIEAYQLIVSDLRSTLV